MRYGLTIALVLALATTASAHDLGNSPAPKPATTYPANLPNPDRQGGDTIADAVVIPSLPFSDSGTTTGYTNDYDEACPYADSVAPEVVYSYTPSTIVAVIIDLCGSDYDTKLYVYDADLNLVACNDDAYFSGDPCGVYVSAIEYVLLQAETMYFIVIDGYGSAHGEYQLSVEEVVPCVLECPAGSFAEGEPPLVDDYVDTYNGGCNTPPDFPFQNLTGDAAGNLVLCGVSGWYQSSGNDHRDTDWFHLHAGPSGAVQITADAEQPMYAFELGHDCLIGPINQWVFGECQPNVFATATYPLGGLIWFVIVPPTFSPPEGMDLGEFDYIIWLSGLEPVVATESTTWGSLKALFQ